VVALLGDGSSLYAFQGLWSAVRYKCGVLFIVLNNGRYAKMDEPAAEAGAKPSRPGFAEVDITALAAALGCSARRVASRADLLATLDELIPGLATRTEPLLLEVPVLDE
jgi:benzoylformate decarboxylase